MIRPAVAEGRSVEAGGPLRVALACARFPPFVGGTEVHVAEVGSRLAARGHDVSVITTVLDPADEGESIVDGMTVVRLRARPARSDLYFAPALRGRIRDGSYDVVHVQGYHTFVAPLAMSGARAADVPYVVTFHSGGHSSPLRRAVRPLQYAALRPQLRGAARLIAVSDYERRSFERRLRISGDRFTTIANGVDDEFVDVRPGGGRHLVTSVGRLVEYKGHHHVIEAFARVVRDVPDASLRIIGSGPWEQNLRDLVAQRGLVERVEIGSVAFGDRGAMAQAMADSHVVVSASAYESQGIVGSEALSTGAALVVYGGSALAELGRHDSVDVVAPSVDELAAAIGRRLAAQRPDLRPVFPSWDDVAEQTEAVYRRALVGAAAPPDDPTR